MTASHDWEITPTLDPTLPEPFDAYLGVRADDTGRLWFNPVVRPGYDEVTFGLIADWMLARISRLLAPDGSEPDHWDVDAHGTRYAFHQPAAGPDWIDALLDQ